MHRFHLTRLSANMKLGGIPASTSSRSTCPDNCNLKRNGCYGDSGPISIHWEKVSSHERGTDIDTHCAEIAALPLRQLWRAFQVGDFPGNDDLLDAADFKKLVKANKGRNGFGFSHYDPAIKHNADLFRFANDSGLTINLSAETIEQADAYKALDVGPVVVVLPADATESFKTPAGHTVIVCPATLGNTTCALCGVCQVAKRKSVIGFPAHGSGARKAEKVFFATVSV